MLSSAAASRVFLGSMRTQIDTQLFARLLKSRDKAGVMDYGGAALYFSVSRRPSIALAPLPLAFSARSNAATSQLEPRTSGTRS